MKRKYFSFLIVLAVAISAPKAEAMNETIKQGIITAAVGIGGTVAGLKIASKICHTTMEPSTKAMFCSMAVVMGIQIGTLTAYSMTLGKEKDRSSCKEGDSLCYSKSGGGNGIGEGEVDADFKALGLDLDKIKADTGRTLAALEKDGYRYDSKDKSVITPNGKIPESQVGSLDALKKSGASGAAMAAASSGLNSIKEATEKAAEELNQEIAKGLGESNYDGGGGGGYRRAGASEGNYNYGSGGMAKLAKPTVTGLSKSDGQGGAIGVAGDNVFGMIHRQYEDQRKQDQFVK